jgi:serine acetyltransferase
VVIHDVPANALAIGVPAKNVENWRDAREDRAEREGARE